jgi:hypothetical protein
MVFKVCGRRSLLMPIAGDRLPTPVAPYRIAFGKHGAEWNVIGVRHGRSSIGDASNKHTVCAQPSLRRFAGRQLCRERQANECPSSRVSA